MSAAADSTGYAYTLPRPLEEIDVGLKRAEAEIVREVVG